MSQSLPFISDDPGKTKRGCIVVFAGNHYTRDWTLLAGVAKEWAIIRQEYRLGARATREQIEVFWDKLFGVDASPQWPNIRKVFDHLSCDELLLGTLRKIFWKDLEPWQRKGYKFSEIHGTIVTRIWLTVIRNAGKWIKDRKKGSEVDVHWARFWNPKNLKTEILRAIKEVEKLEQTQDLPLIGGGLQAPSPCGPEVALEVDELYRKYLSADEIELLEKYFTESQQCTEDEKAEALRILSRIRKKIQDGKRRKAKPTPTKKGANS